MGGKKFINRREKISCMGAKKSHPPGWEFLPQCHVQIRNTSKNKNYHLQKKGENSYFKVVISFPDGLFFA